MVVAPAEAVDDRKVLPLSGLGRLEELAEAGAVDGPGLRKFLDACKESKSKNLSVVNGFCWRYDGPRRETMKQVFDGKIGDIVAIETTYNSHGVWEPRKTREECASDMEYQMRNWYYYSWLSGDHIVEQAVHGIDKIGRASCRERVWR